jgi:hypothetical protein
MMQTQMSPAGAMAAVDESNRPIFSDMVVAIVDKISGRLVYPVMPFGGFLGVGESYHPLPWKMLKHEFDKAALLSTSSAGGERAPSCAAATMPDWSDRAYAYRVDTYYYGVPPYSL